LEVALGPKRQPAFGTVIFDCDSTLSRVEGIEELSAGHRVEVEAMTNAAMRGETRLEEVYARRLELTRPTRAAVEALGRRYIEGMVPDAREVVAALQGAGVMVRVLSGGLLPAVRMLATELGIETPDVAAVSLRFDDDGSYLAFDAGSPLARAGGKADVVRQWLPTLRRPVMLVGDGNTDLEAKPAVDLFVAFAGVAERESVTGAADVVVRSPSLAPVLPLALGAGGTHPGVYDRGQTLIEEGAVTFTSRGADIHAALTGG
jgi:phosphoserine phosphatase